jgi:HSP20 family protein
MTILRWEPFTAFDQLANRRWVPAMDLIETADRFVLRADLPGMREEDVNIEVEDRTLTLSGERARDPREGQDGFFRLERPYGAFSRTLTLPKGVDVDAITASFADGVLEVAIPKPEQAKPRRIEITPGNRELIEE